MPDATPQGLPSQEANRAHEGLDISLRAILTPAGALAIIILIILLITWGLLGLFSRLPARAEASLSPLARLPREAPPPRLQTLPPLDLADFRAKEEAEMNGYGWVDRTTGRVRVPIERAKELFLRETSRGARNAAPTAPNIPAPLATGGSAR